MKLKLDTSSMTALEWRALNAFSAVMAEGEDDAPAPSLWDLAARLKANQEAQIAALRGHTAAQAEMRPSGDTTRHELSPATVEPAVVKENLTTETDINGLPWDERIHSSSRAKNADGSWRIRRNLADGVYEAVVAELKAGNTPPVETASTTDNALQDKDLDPAGSQSDTTPTDDVKGPVEAAKREEWDAAVEIDPYIKGIQDRQSPSAFMLGRDLPQVGVESPNVPGTFELQDDDGPNDEPTPTFTDEEAGEPVIETPANEPAKPDTMSLFWKYVASETKWDDVKRHLSRLTGLDEWKAKTPDVQNAIRAQLWLKVQAASIEVDHTADPTAFFCWMYAQNDKSQADNVEAAFRVLQGEPAYKNNLTDPQRTNIANAVTAHLAQLRA